MAISLAEVWNAAHAVPKEKLPKWYDRKSVAQVKNFMLQSKKSETRVLETMCLDHSYLAEIKAQDEAQYEEIIKRFWAELFRWLESFDLIPRSYYEQTNVG